MTGLDGHAFEAEVSDHLLGKPRTLRRREVSAAVGVPLLEARRFWHALGFPGVGDEDMLFTDADVDALRHIVSLVRSGRLDNGLALSMTRAIARNADRLAAWQASLVVDAIMAHGVSDAPVEDISATLDARPGTAPVSTSHTLTDAQAAQEAGEWLLDLVEDLEPLLVYAWRRHLSASVTGLFAQARREDGALSRTVGFADMVDFTTLVTRLSDQQLGHLVGRFEALTADVVTAHGGRLVKTIGDEVVFVVDDVEAGAQIALDLLDALSEDPSMPSLRVGLATGDVLSHLGDIYGTTVNRASRVTEIAQPDTVVVDDASAEALRHVRALETTRLRSLPLRGLGVTGLWQLRRTVGSATSRRGAGENVRTLRRP